MLQGGLYANKPGEQPPSLKARRAAAKALSTSGNSIFRSFTSVCGRGEGGDASAASPGCVVWEGIHALMKCQHHVSEQSLTNNCLPAPYSGPLQTHPLMARSSPFSPPSPLMAVLLPSPPLPSLPPSLLMVRPSSTPPLPPPAAPDPAGRHL